MIVPKKIANMVRVVPIPMLDDNYGYLLIDEEQKIAAAVDPVQPDKVFAAAEKEGVNIAAVLTTHHHWDHAGGNEQFISMMNEKIPVYGGDDRIGALTNKVGQGDTFKVASIEVKVLFTPCHTTGHVLYFVDHEDQRFLFSGDTLFIGGCGRFFEGTPEQMVDALCNQIASLPKDTQVMCGHEYTVANLEFAMKVDPENDQLQKKLAWAKERRANKEYTIPSTIAEELAFNPFMRVREDVIKKAVNLPQGSDGPQVDRDQGMSSSFRNKSSFWWDYHQLPLFSI